jgi:hypothetical protein
MTYFSSLKFSFSLLVFLTLFACGKKQEEAVKIPRGILSEEIFTKVLTDFALAESASSMNIKNVAITKIDSVYAFNPLTENKVTKSQYDSAISFYVSHPDLYKKIYENVLVALSEMQAKRNPLKKDTSSK